MMEYTGQSEAILKRLDQRERELKAQLAEARNEHLMVKMAAEMLDQAAMYPDVDRFEVIVDHVGPDATLLSCDRGVDANGNTAMLRSTFCGRVSSLSAVAGWREDDGKDVYFKLSLVREWAFQHGFHDIG